MAVEHILFAERYNVNISNYTAINSTVFSFVL